MNWLKKLIIPRLLILVIQLKRLKILDHSHYKYVATQEFNKLTAKTFTARLKEAKPANKPASKYIAEFVKKIVFVKKILIKN